MGHGSTEGHVANMMATSALSEGGGVPSNLNVAVGTEHAHPLAMEGRRELPVTVQENNQDGGMRKRGKANIPKNLSRRLAKGGGLEKGGQE